MRIVLLTSLVLLAAGCTGDPQPNFRHGPPDLRGQHGRPGSDGAGGGPRGRLFISPMGETFRAERGGKDPQDMWFEGADTDHDGALSRTEFSADASRFFKLLDRGHDGEIDPDDIDYYETVLAPEIRVSGGGMAGGRLGGSGRSGGGHHGGARGGAGRRGGGGGGGSSDASGGPTVQATYGKQGAARFSYFDFPEPVTIADTNFNRGVDPAEFQHAADLRFAMLDKNGDGRIERGELPRIAPGPGRWRGAPGAAIDPPRSADRQQAGRD